jgi:vitamin-K-epoxide reductase (warfarin-sensitive)
MRYVIAVLAVVGIIVSSLALHVHYSQDVEVCDINAHWDCGIVNHSRYAEIGHIPVAAIGIAGYAVLALLAMRRRNQLLAILSLLGLAFSLYLTHIEAKVLQIWCLYCVISQTLVAAIALLSIIVVVRQRTRASSTRA